MALVSIEDEIDSGINALRSEPRQTAECRYATCAGRCRYVVALAGQRIGSGDAAAGWRPPASCDKLFAVPRLTKRAPSACSTAPVAQGTDCIPRRAPGISPGDRLGPGWARRSAATAREWRAPPASTAGKNWKSVGIGEAGADPRPSGHSDGNPIPSSTEPANSSITSPQVASRTQLPKLFPELSSRASAPPTAISHHAFPPIHFNRSFGESRNGASQYSPGAGETARC